MSVEGDDASDSTVPSRLPYANRAGAKFDRQTLSTLEITDRWGVEVRAEAVDERGDGSVRGTTWGQLTQRWRWWYDDQRGTEAVVEGTMSGERVSFRTPNRFTPDYRKRLYAKAQSLERSLRDKWGRLLHSTMVTLTASSTTDDGKPRPPLDHLEDLLGSWEAVRRALNRVLEGREWEYLAILEPHESGYVHLHLAVFTKGPVVREQFGPVVEAHLRNCEGAGREAHDLEDDSTVTVRRAADRRNGGGGVESLGAYLAAYIGGEYETEATDQPGYVQRFYALMWASGRQWWRPSNGAQQYMQPPENEGDDDGVVEDYEFVGISPSGDPETDLVRCQAGGSVDRRRTRPPPGRGESDGRERRRGRRRGL